MSDKPRNDWLNDVFENKRVSVDEIVINSVTEEFIKGVINLYDFEYRIIPDSELFIFDKVRNKIIDGIDPYPQLKTFMEELLSKSG